MTETEIQALIGQLEEKLGLTWDKNKPRQFASSGGRRGTFNGRTR